MRLLLILLILVLIALLAWAAYQRASRRAAAAPGQSERYRVIETTGDGQAHVFIGRGSPSSAVLVGSVPIDAEDFDERYGALVLRAQDRAATLNATRELHAGE